MNAYVEGPLSEYDVQDIVDNALKQTNYDANGEKDVDRYLDDGSIVNRIMNQMDSGEYPGAQEFGVQYARFIQMITEDSDEEELFDLIVGRDDEFAKELNLDSEDVNRQLREVYRKVLDSVTFDFDKVAETATAIAGDF